MANKLYDPACADLAKHFTQDDPERSEVYMRDFAAHIQEAVETFMTCYVERDSRGYAIGHPKHCRINGGMVGTCNCGKED